MDYHNQHAVVVAFRTSHHLVENFFILDGSQFLAGQRLRFTVWF